METNYRSLQSGVNSNKRIVSQKLEVSNMSYHQRNPSTNIMLRPVESNAQHKSRSSSNNLTSEHAHGNTPLFLPFAIDSSRGPEFRFVHQGAYATSPYRDMQFIGSPQVSQIEVNRSGPMVSVPNSLSVSFHSNTVDSISSRPRMSLLPHGNDFIQYRPHQLPHVNSENLNQSGLKIETRDLNNSITSGSYHPMVEAISPTGEESNAEELGNAKNELMTHMSKLDSEISETEKTISLLKKKQAMLEETASFKPECQSDETSEHVPKHRSLAQNIYAENRKKALAAHAILNLLGPSNDYPIYNQPKDAQVCQYIIEQHKSFKEKLVRHLKTKKLNNAMRQTETAEKYCQMSLEWNKKVEKIESTLKRKTKEAKSREFFEKVFPELRKQREDKERFNRVGSRIKSEADVEEIIDGLQEQAMEDKKMRSYAVIPPLMLNVEKKRCIFKNENGALIDMEIEFKERQNINVWTSGEKETFKEKFLQHPKNFGAIAASLDRKTAQDCVRYYYLSKKTENYKQLLRKSRQRTRSSKNPQKPNQNSTPSIIDAMTTGVLTRLQREQQQKSGTKERTASNIRSNNSVTPSSNIAVNNNNISLTIGCENVEPISVTNNIHSKQIDMFPASNTISLNTRKVEENELIVPSSPKHEMKSALMESSCQKTPDEIFKTSESRTESLNFEETDEHRIIDHISTVESLNDSTGSIKRRRLETETSDSDGLLKDNENLQPCFVCKTKLGTRTKPIDKSKASLYGINEEFIPSEASVCHTCQSKIFKSRYTTCPLPTCPNPKDRIKRFRNIPPKLLELPTETKNAIINEFQITPDVIKCCSSCSVKLRKRIDFYLHGVSLNDDQILKIKTFIKENGVKWNQMSEILNTPATALKLFYQNYKTTYGFDKSLAEYFESHPNENKEFASSEGEESDMTASSSDERDINSDTASAESPGNQNNKENSTSTSMKELLIPEKDNRLIPPLNQPPKRQKIQEEYDSSATETADEENESSPANRQSPKVIHYPFSSLSNGPRSDSNVRDIIGNVIEKAIKEQSIGLMPPVAKIITCPADSKSEITFIKEYRNESSRTISHVKSDNFSTVSIDIPERTGQNIKNSFVSTTITPVIQKGSQFSSNSNNKTDLEPQTLDLSVKKTRDHFASPGLIQSHGIMMYRDSAVSTGQIQVSHAQALTSQSQNFSSFNSEGRTNKSPLSFQAVSVPVSPTQQQSMSSMKNLTQSVSQSQSGCKTKMVQKLSPKTSQNQQVSTMKGSITHGTPVSSTSAMLSSPNSRYDNIFRQTPPIDKCGSITQGTPVSHIVGAQFPDKRMYDYFKSNRQSPASMTSQSTSPQSGSFGNMFNRSVAFTDNAQLSSKQILLNDYITSQQMIGRGNRTEKDIQRGSQSVSTSPATIYYNEKERNRTEYINRTSPADRNSVLSPQHSSSPQRQETPENLRRSHPIKVIQRHNTSLTKSPSPVSSRMHFSQPTFLSGHEAFSSLVDVASKQPFLPVPTLKDEKRSSIPIISIDQQGSMGDDLRYQLAREQIAVMQRQQLQHMQMQQHTQQHQQRSLHQKNQKYFPDLEKERREEDILRDRERVHQLEREKDRIHLVEMERNILMERGIERHRIKTEENDRTKFGRPAELERPFRPQISSRGDTTFTAANLINAIITHQISQNNTDPPIMREVSRHPQVQSSRDIITPPTENTGKGGSPNVINIELDPSNVQNPENVTKIKLGDLAESIITKDYGPPALHGVRSNFSQHYQQDMFSEQWKQNKRINLQKDETQNKNNSLVEEEGSSSNNKQIVKISQSPSPRQRHTFHEPVSPPDTQIYSLDKRSVHHSSASQEFALDCYVKSRIAEAMRTEGDKRADDREKNLHVHEQNTNIQEPQLNVIGPHSKVDHQLIGPTTSYAPAVYAYPYSALNMVSGGNSLVPSKSQSSHNVDNSVQSKSIQANPSSSHTLQVTEPKPLLSAQYEALSDED